MELALDQAPVVVLAALVGWCLGFTSAWVTDRLQVQDELPSAAHGPLIRDVAVQAGCALIWAAAAVLLDGPWWRWVAGGILAVPLVQVAITDASFTDATFVGICNRTALLADLSRLIHEAAAALHSDPSVSARRADRHRDGRP
jgi:hypothetical protein